jgi:hypothetical protein
MRHLLTVAILAVAAFAAAEAPAEGPKTCNKTCDNRYPQCVADAIEYGYERPQAIAGCRQKQKDCKERCK